MADIGADRSGRGQPDLRVHVGAVHVDLAAVLVDHGADIADGGLEHAVRRWVGDHQRRQPVGMLLRLCAQIGQIDVAVAVAADDHHFQPGHRGAGGVGAVRGGWDQAHVAMLFAAGFVPCADRQQTGIFALRAGIRLQRNFGEAGGGAEPGLQTADQGQVAGGLVRRRERDACRRTRAGDRDHLGRGVQLHRAGTQRDHAAVERDVLVLQPLQIAQHLVFGVMLVESRLRQERRSTQHLGRDRGDRSRQVGAQQAGQRDQVVAGDGFVQRDADAGCVDPAQIVAGLRRHGRSDRLPPSTTIVSKNASWRMRQARRGWRRPPACAPAAKRGGRCGATRPARARRRRIRRSRPAAPARCRYWRWLSRGGCVARGSAAPGAWRVGRRHPATRRPGGRAWRA